MSIGITELQRDLCDAIRGVEASGEPLLVTRRGRAVAALVAVDPQRGEDSIVATLPHAHPQDTRGGKTA